MNERKVIFLESPGSLTFEVQDIPAIVAVAKQHVYRHRARQHMGDAVVVLPRSRTAWTYRSLRAPIYCRPQRCDAGQRDYNDALGPRIQNGAWTFGQIYPDRTTHGLH